MGSLMFGISTRLFRYDRTVGRRELGGTGFMAPVDIALGPDGAIYVLSRGWEALPHTLRITIMTLDEDFLGQFGRLGEAEGEFLGPSSIAIDSGRNVYVTDEWLNRISIFDKDGVFLDKWGVPGSGDGQLNKPSGIKFDIEDTMYLVDSGNHRVQKFTKDGKFLGKWGTEGIAEGQFNFPWGLAIDARGDVYVADWRNDRIQKFTNDGQLLAQFGSTGSEVSEFRRPTGVAVDKEGDIYVADWYNDRVQVLTPDGRHITTFTGDATMSKWGQAKLEASPELLLQYRLLRDFEEWRHFRRPKTVEIDDDGKVIILDNARSRLQVYQKDNYLSKVQVSG